MENQIQKHQEESTAVVLRLPGKKYSLNDLGKDLRVFNDAQQGIIQARQQGVSLCDQPEKQFKVSLTGIIFSISVICGSQLPTHDAHINALEKEFGKFLNDSGYDGLTTEEILTAFRMNANFKLDEKVETYGAIFNIDFAAKVLRLYREKRGDVDEMATGIFQKREYDATLNKESDRRRKKVVEQFELFLKNDDVVLDLSDCFMQLREDGAFSNKKFPGDELTHFKGSDGLEKLKNSFEGLDARFEREHKAVKFLFQNMKATGRLKIYEDGIILHPGFELPQQFDEI